MRPIAWVALQRCPILCMRVPHVIIISRSLDFNDEDAIMPENNDLSERELEILRLVATGASNKEIAQNLFISTNTVKVHLRNIFSKISVNSRTEAALFVINSEWDQNKSLAIKSSSVLPTSDLSDVIPVQKAEEVGNGADLIKEKKLREKIRDRTWWLILIPLLVIGTFGISIIVNRLPTRATTAVPQQDSEQPRWKVLTPMPTPRSGLAVAGIENFIYAIGGETRENITNVVEKYDPVSDRWEALRSKPTAVKDIGAAVLGGKIYVPGGQLANGKMSNVLEIYDPQTNTWSDGQPMPISTSGYGITSFEGKIYLFGGKDGGDYLDVVLEYDPINDQWQSKTPMPTERSMLGAVSVGEKIFVIGGINNSGILPLNEVYQPNQDIGSINPWSIGPSLPYGLYAMGVASIADTIQVIGGKSNKNDQADSLRLLPFTNEWQELGSMSNQSLTNLGIIPLGTKLYIVGGKYGENPSDLNLSYQAIYLINMPVIVK